MARRAGADDGALAGRTLLAVWLQPGAAVDELTGWQGEVLRARVAAPPIGGQANEALLRLLAASLGVPPSHVAIVRGRTARRKLVCVSGLAPGEVRSRLGGVT